jgi:hypothetical protein
MGEDKLKKRKVFGGRSVIVGVKLILILKTWDMDPSR